MKRIALFFAGLLCCTCVLGQVGIGTTSPSAQLDIRSTNQVSPANTDGLLIPKIDEFPAIDPSAAGDGLLVYATGNGTVSKGFYYWNNLSGSWVALATGVAEWTSTGTDIERQSGNVYIGDNNGTNNDLYISDRVIDWDNPAYYLDPSSISQINEIQFDDGSAGDPSMRFAEGNTGFFSPASDEVSYSANGVESVRIDSGGRVEFLDTTEANQTPGTGVIEVAGSLRIDGNEIVTNSTTTLFLQNGNEGDVRMDTSTLIVDASEDFVGIGLVNPHFTLDVDGPVMLEDTTAPTALAGHSGIYSSFGELFSIDDSGNSTVISPHHFGLMKPSDPMAWSFYSRNERIGEQINVDMFRVVWLVEQLSGETLIYKADLNGNPVQSEHEEISLSEKVKKLQSDKVDLQQELEVQKLRISELERKIEQLYTSDNQE